MEAFWIWMEEKGYYKDFAEWYEYVVTEEQLDERKEYIPKQMLIGYMIEYLLETDSSQMAYFYERNLFDKVDIFKALKEHIEKPWS